MPTINNVLTKLEVNSLGIIFTEYTVEVLDDDGVLIASGQPHRESLTPDTSVDSIVSDSPNVKSIAAIVWTPDVVQAYKTALIAATPIAVKVQSANPISEQAISS